MFVSKKYLDAFPHINGRGLVPLGCRHCTTGADGTDHRKSGTQLLDSRRSRTCCVGREMSKYIYTFSGCCAASARTTVCGRSSAHTNNRSVRSRAGMVENMPTKELCQVRYREREGSGKPGCCAPVPLSHIMLTKSPGPSSDYTYVGYRERG